MALEFDKGNLVKAADIIRPSGEMEVNCGAEMPNDSRLGCGDSSSLRSRVGASRRSGLRYE
jgi:hypothetical protein